jgi:hypothetical protein
VIGVVGLLPDPDPGADGPGAWAFRVRNDALAAQGLLAGDLMVAEPTDRAGDGATVIATDPAGGVVLGTLVLLPGGLARLERGGADAVVVPASGVQARVVAVLRLLGDPS